MAGRISEDEIRRIKEATDLAALIGDYTQVVRAGSALKACCPFHDERTPSFYIYEDDQHYHCYGCGAHGDAVSLVTEKENLDFIGVMEFLARRAGLEIRYEKSEQPGQRRGVSRHRRMELQEVFERATRLYEAYLWDRPEGAEARDYLASRGLTDEVCREFRLGWAPGYGKLVNAATKRGVNAKQLLELDLAIERDSGLADRFYERLMFPICDRFGQPIAFSGRLLPAAEKAAKEAGRGVGKYVNSTDTPLYRKGHVVFNLHRARKPCRGAGRLVVMEGPTDVMAAHQAGMEECVAVLGTAMTADHTRQLGRCTGEKGRLLLLFDGDRAGQDNSLKAVKTCLSIGQPSHVAVVPDGKDPAEFLSSDAGVVGFQELLDQARPDVLHLLRTMAPKHINDERARWQVVDRLLDMLRPVNDRDLRDAFLSEVGAHFNIEEQRLARRLKERVADEPAPRQAPSEEEDVPDIFRDEAPVAKLSAAQDQLLGVLATKPDSRATAFDDCGIEPSDFPAPWSLLVDRMMEEPDVVLDQLLMLEGAGTLPTVRKALFTWARRSAGTSEKVDVSELAGRLRCEVMDQRIEALQFDMRTLQQDGKHDEAGQLFGELCELQRLRADMALS